MTPACQECGKPNRVQITIPGVDFIEANFCGDVCRAAWKVRKSLQVLEAQRQAEEWHQSFTDWAAKGRIDIPRRPLTFVRVKEK